MKIGLVTLAYREARFMPKFLSHIPDWVDEKLVLCSTKPWQGDDEPDDGTADLARQTGARAGAAVIEYHWLDEASQRNAGQEYFHDFDWIITLDVDEYLDNEGWNKLKEFLDEASESAYVVDSQLTYWKRGFVIDPREDYKQIVVVRPHVRFIDKRVVNCRWAYAPVTLHHLSWARTDAECLSKISHYSHGHELDPNWYKDVWKADKRENVHPLTPEALRHVVPTELPDELEKLELWP